MDIGTLLIGMALGATACCGLMGWLQRPVQRTTAESTDPQWTVEAAEALARGWKS